MADQTDRTDETDGEDADSEVSGRKSARGRQAHRKQSAEETEAKAKEKAEESSADAKRGEARSDESEGRDDGDGQQERAEASQQVSAEEASGEAVSEDEAERDAKPGGAPDEDVDEQEKQPDEEDEGPYELEMEITEALGETAHAPDRDEVDPVDFGVEWLENVFEHMNYDIDVEGRLEDDRLYFDATGKDAEVLLGVGSSKPRSVDAIQTLMTAALGRYTDSRRIFLDVGGFREQRADRLEKLARDLRDNVERIGKSITVAGLQSHERRVVHDALKEDGSVRTESEGDGIFRKLNIKPAG